MKDYSCKLPVKPVVFTFSDSGKVVLRKGEGWKDTYLEELILPLLNGTSPGRTEQINSSINSKVWKTDAFPQLFLKLFMPRGLRDKLLFRKSRSLRAAESGIMLLQKGFHTPALIAQGELLRNHCKAESFLLTEGVNESFNVYSYVEHFSVNNTFPGAIQEKRDLIRAFGNEIGRLHRKGIFHGDLRPGNILIRYHEDNPIFYFIDNERNRHFQRGVPIRFRMKNLVQINMLVSPEITFTDRLRFFEAYIEENAELKPRAKSLARNVFLKTKKRLSKKIPGIWNAAY